MPLPYLTQTTIKKTYILLKKNCKKNLIYLRKYKNEIKFRQATHMWVYIRRFVSPMYTLAPIYSKTRNIIQLNKLKMFHETSKEFFYSAYKINVEHSDGNKTLTGTATGFLLQIAPGVAWIITNRHVIDLDYKKATSKFKDFKMSKLIITGRKQDDTEYSFKLHEEAEIYFHENYENDIAVIRAHCYLVEGQSFHWHFGLSHLADENIYKQIDPFDLVCYSGFPQTHDKLSNRPILRSGHIASDPQYDYSWDNNYQGKCVAYEGFSSEGASGSPIFAPPRGLRNIPNSRHGFLIGVNAGHIPDQNGHSGISFFYKSTVIHDIINSNGLLEKHNK